MTSPTEQERAFIEAARQSNLSDLWESMKEGVNIEARDKNGNTALCVAAALGHRDVVKLLIEAGADIYAENGAGNSALKLAGAYTPDLVEFLKAESARRAAQAKAETIAKAKAKKHKKFKRARTAVQHLL